MICVLRISTGMGPLVCASRAITLSVMFVLSAHAEQCLMGKDVQAQLQLSVGTHISFGMVRHVSALLATFPMETAVLGVQRKPGGMVIAVSILNHILLY